MEERILEDIFLREKPAKILLGLKTSANPTYATVLAKEANCTFSHTIKILNLFKRLGIVKFEKLGRIKKVMLTEEGWDIAHNLEAIVKKFVIIEENYLKLSDDKKKKSKQG